MSDLPLILLAARQHPDADLRLRLTACIEDHLSDSGPRYSEAEVAEALGGINGTPIEPFTLSQEDRFLTTPLVRLAFSSRYQRTRFRVVSRDTIGPEGGAVLTNNLRHHYVERYARGRWRQTKKDFWFVAPAEVPPLTTPGTPASVALEATCLVSESGVTIYLDADWPPDNIHSPSVGQGLNRHSRFLPSESTLQSAGLSVAATGRRLTISTRGPEAIFRLSALMQQRAIMVIDEGGEGGGLGRVFIGLVPLESDEMRLRALLTFGRSWAERWVNIDPAHSLPLSLADRLAIAAWYRPHDSWIDDEFMEAVFE
jgi:hypothetical protein